MVCRRRQIKSQESICGWEGMSHHVVDTEISEMCVVNDSRDVKSDQVLVHPVQWSLVPSHEYEFYPWAGENNKMMEFKRTSRTAGSLNIPG